MDQNIKFRTELTFAEKVNLQNRRNNMVKEVWFNKFAYPTTGKSREPDGSATTTAKYNLLVALFMWWGRRQEVLSRFNMMARGHKIIFPITVYYGDGVVPQESENTEEAPCILCRNYACSSNADVSPNEDPCPLAAYRAKKYNLASDPDNTYDAEEAEEYGHNLPCDYTHYESRGIPEGSEEESPWEIWQECENPEPMIADLEATYLDLYGKQALDDASANFTTHLREATAEITAIRNGERDV